MKFFRETEDWSNQHLLKTIKKLITGMFCMGLVLGISIVMAAVSSKANNSEDTFLFIASALFFLALSIMFYVFLCKKIIPDLEKRLNS